MKLKTTVALVTIVAASAIFSVASAHDHQVPRVVARQGGQQTQRALILASCWIQPADTSDFIVNCTDYPWRFPGVDKVRANQRLVLRIKKEQMPTKTLIHAWPRRDKETGEPRGRVLELDHSRLPVFNENSAIWAWDLVFEVPDPGRRYYIRLSGEWPDVEFPEESQTAQWAFYLRS